jgi:TorA maturation chaperone TorD
MNAIASPVALLRALPPEEAARGDFYALLARFFHAAPDATLLRALAGAEPISGEADAALADSWRDLVNASSVMDAEAALEEYEALFAGVGKAAVSIYAGHYSGAAAVDHPRVRLREQLALLGLAYREQVTEPEDHFGAIFDVMRVLVVGGAGRSPASLPEQRKFFEGHLLPGMGKFFGALQAAPQANYYRKVAALGAAFAALEAESFQLD